MVANDITVTEMDEMDAIFTVGQEGTATSTVTVDGLTVQNNAVPNNVADQKGWTAVQSGFGSSTTVRNAEFSNNQNADNLFLATETGQTRVAGGTITDTSGSLPLVSLSFLVFAVKNTSHFK